MKEVSKVPTSQLKWENVNGNIWCNKKECKIMVNLPNERKEKISFEVTKET